MGSLITRMRTIPALMIAIVLLAAGPIAQAKDSKTMSTLKVKNADRIKPWNEDTRYWQYKGRPVLLLGGSVKDSLFQIPDLEEHLDLLAATGGNVIRNTMSDRQTEKTEAYPYKRLKNGKFDLDQWNDEYWRRFESLMRLTAERDIIVQIEVWDRFDQTDSKGSGHWRESPYRPGNNVNYTDKDTGLSDKYLDHPARDKHPFYHTVPGMAKYKPIYKKLHAYQERFVNKMLDHSLPRGNVLYCMNNETSTEPKWGLFWMNFIRQRARKEGVEVCVTDMFDDVWKPQTSAKLKFAFANPKEYQFIDISQVNSRSFGEDQWTNIDWIRKQNVKHPRPLNNTKIYSDGEFGFGTGVPKDGLERFWRHLIGGAASCRFHRPPAGIGLNEISQACVKSGRLIESRIKLWDVETHMELLGERSKNEAYLAADPGKQYILFMSDGGSVTLDLTKSKGAFNVEWVNVRGGKWSGKGRLQGGKRVTVKAPKKGPWVAAITRQ